MQNFNVKIYLEGYNKPLEFIDSYESIDLVEGIINDLLSKSPAYLKMCNNKKILVVPTKKIIAIEIERKSGGSRSTITNSTINSQNNKEKVSSVKQSDFSEVLMMADESENKLVKDSNVNVVSTNFSQDESVNSDLDSVLTEILQERESTINNLNSEYEESTLNTLDKLIVNNKDEQQ